MNNVQIPVFVTDDLDLPDHLMAQSPGNGIVRVRRGLTIDQVLIVVREAVLCANGEHHRTEHAEAAGFEEAPNGGLRPALTVHAGGGKPDRRRTRRPQLKVVGDDRVS